MTFHANTTVLPGHRIELKIPELPVGSQVTVLVALNERAVAKRPLNEVLGDYPGGRLFQSAEEVEAYLKAERDSWDNEQS